MSFTDAARSVVVRTGRWPGLNALYQQAYDLGLSFTARRLASVPGVLAVMLRTNDDRRAWVPGLSDYDLTVLTEPWDGPRTLRFLDGLWSRYRSIKSHVPQLGEMEVMNLEEYTDFLTFGPQPTGSLKRAQPLIVKTNNSAIEQIIQQRPRRPDERDFLLDGLSRYAIFVFAAWLDDGKHGSALTRRRLEHLLGNVAKRLSRVGVVLEMDPACPIDDRMVLVFQGLAQACRQTTPDRLAPKAAFDPPGVSISRDSVAPIQDFCEIVLEQSAIRCCSAIAWISYLSLDELRLVFLVPDDVPEQELRRLLMALKGLHHPLERLLQRPVPSGMQWLAGVPTVASDSMWRCWCDVSPFAAIAVAATGRALIGPLDSGLTLPSLTSLKRGAEVQYASMIPLKNNWRLSGHRPTGEEYVPFVTHAKAYASASTGVVQTRPAALTLTSLEHAYLASLDALKELRATLEFESTAAALPPMFP